MKLARLGRRSRELLAEATAGQTQVAQWTFGEVAMQSRRRAAHALARMGLVILSKLPGYDAQHVGGLGLGQLALLDQRGDVSLEQVIRRHGDADGLEGVRAATDDAGVCHGSARFGDLV